jgi:hypothetical protein
MPSSLTPLLKKYYKTLGEKGKFEFFKLTFFVNSLSENMPLLFVSFIILFFLFFFFFFFFFYLVSSCKAKPPGLVSLWSRQSRRQQ